jgi:hypothetical protein
LNFEVLTHAVTRGVVVFTLFEVSHSSLPLPSDFVQYEKLQAVKLTEPHRAPGFPVMKVGELTACVIHYEIRDPSHVQAMICGLMPIVNQQRHRKPIYQVYVLLRVLKTGGGRAGCTVGGVEKLFSTT